MTEAGVEKTAIEVFSHYYRLLENGETGMIPESSIEPLDMESLADVEISEEAGAAALRTTAVIKLNGGLPSTTPRCR
jgi:UTP--glucose-1-phosphate uridylyltransferase